MQCQHLWRKCATPGTQNLITNFAVVDGQSHLREPGKDHPYIHTLDYITLHYVTLRAIILHYIALHLHYITLHHITLHYITLHHITSHHITSH